jgi:ABC-type multidrug transport system ATPase subunit
VSAPTEVDKIRKTLQGRPIPKDISFSVEQGDILGFLGPNGAGKTTTIRILLGFYRADSGHASVMGRDAGSDASRESVGFVLHGDARGSLCSSACRSGPWPASSTSRPGRSRWCTSP